MALKNDSFGFSRYWLMTAFRELPLQPDILTPKKMAVSRKAFLAGNNQLVAIKNWLLHSGVAEITRGNTTLTELGQLMAAQDPKAEMAWTWWLFHLHLSINPEAFPYSGFFLLYDSEGRWMPLDEITDSLFKYAEEKQLGLSQDTVDSYFSGVARTFQAGGFVHEIGLIEERTLGDGRSSRKVRRRLCRPDDIVVAYAAVLFQKQFYSGQATVEAREILGKGLARALGIRDSDIRESLSRITTHKDLSHYVQYRQQVNQDSIQFLRPADAALRDIRTSSYRSQAVKWQ
jgi:hypothetical protein